jgi:hypothetical protein
MILAPSQSGISMFRGYAMNRLFACLLFVLLPASSSLGATVRFIDILSTTYTPGTPYNLKVALPGMTNLGSYQVDVKMSSTSGVAGTDYFFSGFIPSPPVGGAVTRGYVFPSSANFAKSTNSTPSETVISLTDFNFDGTDIVGVNVLENANDLLGELTIMTLPSFSGNLSLSFDPTTLILDTPAVPPASVAEFAQIRTELAGQSPLNLTTTAVPEPIHWFFAAAGATHFCRRSLRKRAPRGGSC